jgi:hypothetical protein
MADLVDSQAALESLLKGEIIKMYQEVADNPEKEFHFYLGREAAELFKYEIGWLNRAPVSIIW